MKYFYKHPDLQPVYSEILDFTNLIIAISSLPVLFSSLRINISGFHWIFIFHIILTFIVCGIYLLRKRLNMNIRIVTIIVVLMVLILPTIPFTRNKNVWEIIIFLTSVVASIFYGKRVGFIVIVYGFIYHIVFGYLYLISPNISGFTSIFSYKDTFVLINRIIITTMFPVLAVIVIDKFRNYFIKTIDCLSRANKKIVETEKRSRLFSEITFEGIMIHENGFIIDMNLSFLKLIKYTEEELVGKNVIELLVPKKYRNIVYENIKKQYNLPYEIEAIRKDGSIIPVEIEAKDVKTDSGRIIRTIAVRDITERIKNRKQLEESKKRVEESEKLYRGIFENMIGAFFKTDVTGKIILAGPSAMELTGYSEEEYMGKDISEFYVNKRQILGLINNLQLEGSVERYRTEIKTKKRGNITIEVNAKMVFDKEGRYTGIEGIFYDITEQVHKEELIKRLTTAVQQSSNTIVITDTNGNIEYVNPAFSKVTGYLFEEVVGRNPRILNSGIQPKEYYTSMWKSIKQGDTWRGEFCNKTKQGELFWENVTITPIKDKVGKVINFLAIKEDITIRKRIEAELKENQKRIVSATIEAEEKERLRIARELHDGISPTLAALKIYIQSLSKFKKKEVIEELYKKSDYTIDEIIKNLSEISNNLSPHILQNFGLKIAIQNFIEKITDINKVKIEYIVDIKTRLNIIIETTIYRITTEFINNTLKHSNANRINILIKKSNNLYYQYIDNGEGFDYQSIMSDSKGMGLRNIVSRIESINGTIEIDSVNGFHVEIMLPLEL